MIILHFYPFARPFVCSSLFIDISQTIGYYTIKPKPAYGGSFFILGHRKPNSLAIPGLACLETQPQTSYEKAFLAHHSDYCSGCGVLRMGGRGHSSRSLPFRSPSNHRSRTHNEHRRNRQCFRKQRLRHRGSPGEPWMESR